MAMEESKVTKMALSFSIAGSERIINDYLKDYKPKWLAICRKVKRYTREGKDRKFIVWPHCDQGNFVFHFSWSTLSCQHCGTMVDKYDWKLL